MKYYPSSGRKKNGTGLYIVIAFGLIAVGIIAWFTVSRISRGTTESPTPSTTPSKDQTYDKPYTSYNDTTGPDSTMSDVANSVSDIPYASSEPEVSKPQKSEPKQAPIMPIDGEILKDFSNSALQFSQTYGDMRLHTGLDIKAELGATVKSSASGTVTATDESALFGKTVTIDHGDGIIIKYCGLENVLVSTGKKVNMGDPIAVVGSIPSECADNSHIHLEATKNGEVVSPLDVIGKIPE